MLLVSSSLAPKLHSELIKQPHFVDYWVAGEGREPKNSGKESKELEGERFVVIPSSKKESVAEEGDGPEIKAAQIRWVYLMTNLAKQISSDGGPLVKDLEFSLSYLTLGQAVLFRKRISATFGVQVSSDNILRSAGDGFTIGKFLERYVLSLRSFRRWRKKLRQLFEELDNSEELVKNTDFFNLKLEELNLRSSELIALQNLIADRFAVMIPSGKMFQVVKEGRTLEDFLEQHLLPHRNRLERRSNVDDKFQNRVLNLFASLENGDQLIKMTDFMDLSLSELGLSSLQMVGLQDAISKEFGVFVPSGLLFEAVATNLSIFQFFKKYVIASWKRAVETENRQKSSHSTSPKSGRDAEASRLSPLSEVDALQIRNLFGKIEKCKEISTKEDFLQILLLDMNMNSTDLVYLKNTIFFDFGVYLPSEVIFQSMTESITIADFFVRHVFEKLPRERGGEETGRARGGGGVVVTEQDKAEILKTLMTLGSLRPIGFGVFFYYYYFISIIIIIFYFFLLFFFFSFIYLFILCFFLPSFLTVDNFIINKNNSFLLNREKEGYEMLNMSLDSFYMNSLELVGFQNAISVAFGVFVASGAVFDGFFLSLLFFFSPLFLF